MTEQEAVNTEEGMEPKQRNTLLIAAAVIIVLFLCCCLFLALAWFFGDSVVEQFSSVLNMLPLIL